MEFLFKKENIEKIHIENIGNPKIIASTKISLLPLILDLLSIFNYLASLISLGHKVRKYWTKY